MKKNKIVIQYKDIDNFIKINSNDTPDNLTNLTSLLGAFLEHLILYGMEDDYETFGVVIEPEDRQSIINFLDKNDI